MSVFISYSHKDSDFVDHLHKSLIERDIPIFLDKLALNVGDSIISKIENAIEESRLILVVISSNSVDSNWCRLELNSGWVRELEENNVVVVPLIIDNCKIPLFLKTKKYANFSKSYDHGLNELMKLLISLDRTQNSLSNYDDKNLQDFGWVIGSKDNDIFVDIDCIQQTVHTPRPEHIIVSNMKIYFPAIFSISFMAVGIPETHNRKKVNALMNRIATNGLQEFIEIKDGLKSYNYFSFKHLDETFNIDVTCRKLGPRDGNSFMWRFSSLLQFINESAFNYDLPNKTHVSSQEQEQEFNRLLESLEENCLKLPAELITKLAKPLDGRLYIIELTNDDITPMKYVVEILIGCFELDKETAINTMLNVHEKNSSQVLTGSKDTLEEVIAFIENDARTKKYPLKFKLSPVDL